METRQPFSNDYLGNIYGMLEYQAKRGKPWDYEVRIDHFVAVPRTNDPYQFYDYEHVLNDTACELVVLVFKGHSRVSDKYILTIKEPPLTGGAPKRRFRKCSEKKRSSSTRRWKSVTCGIRSGIRNERSKT